jgi:hypothetical protein
LQASANRLAAFDSTKNAIATSPPPAPQGFAAVRGGLCHDARWVLELEGGCKARGELDQQMHARIVPRRVVAPKLFHLSHEITGPRSLTRPDQADVQLFRRRERARLHMIGIALEAQKTSEGRRSNVHATALWRDRCMAFEGAGEQSLQGVLIGDVLTVGGEHGAGCCSGGRSR